MHRGEVDKTERTVLLSLSYLIPFILLTNSSQILVEKCLKIQISSMHRCNKCYSNRGTGKKEHAGAEHSLSLFPNVLQLIDSDHFQAVTNND